jgi:hypothetical protein
MIGGIIAGTLIFIIVAIALVIGIFVAILKKVF